jgi:hypothetical protein
MKRPEEKMAELLVSINIDVSEQMKLLKAGMNQDQWERLHDGLACVEHNVEQARMKAWQFREKAEA